MIAQSIALEHKKLDVLREKLESLPDYSAFGMFTRIFLKQVATATEIPEYILRQPWVPVQRDQNGVPIDIQKMTFREKAPRGESPLYSAAYEWMRYKTWAGHYVR